MDSNIVKSAKGLKEPNNSARKKIVRSKPRASKQPAAWKVTTKEKPRKLRKQSNDGPSSSGGKLSGNSLVAFSNTSTKLRSVLGCDEENSTSQLPGEVACPTCDKLFKKIDLAKHVFTCLPDKPVSAVKKLPKNIAKNDCLKKSGKKLKNTCIVHNPKRVNAEPYLCPKCNFDLSKFGADQRNTHINRCIDHSMKKNVLAKNSRCPLCSKVLSSKSNCSRHLISCPEKHKQASDTLVALHCPNDDGRTGNEHLSSLSAGESSVENWPKPEKKAGSKVKPKTRIKKDALQLAISVSKKKSSERKRTIKGKQKVSVIPLMITLSPSSNELQAELHSMARPNGSNADNDISISHASVTSNLRLARNNVLRQRDCSVGEALSDENRPGPSGLRSQNPVRSIQNEDELPPSAGSANVQPANAANVSEQSEVWPNQPAYSSLRSNQSSPAVFHNDELQSPEVSSSNMKNMSLAAECNESPSRSGHETRILQRCEVQRSNTDISRGISPPRDSRWPAANSSRLSPSLYHAHGPLTLSKQERRRGLSGPISCLMTESDMDRIEGQQLDHGDENNSANSDHAAKVESLMNSCDVAAEENGALSPRNRMSSSQPVATFLKLIDNPRFSDAEILAGELEESIKLHQNILFCCCPHLLEEIVSTENNVLRLADYTKSEIMPVINYIYSSCAQSLLTAARSDKAAFCRTVQLLKRFCVNIRDADQKLLDAELELVNEIAPEMHVVSTMPEKLMKHDRSAELKQFDQSIAEAENETVCPYTEKQGQDEIPNKDTIWLDASIVSPTPLNYSGYTLPSEPIANFVENTLVDPGLLLSEPLMPSFQEDSRDSVISDASLPSTKPSKGKLLAKGRLPSRKKSNTSFPSAKGVKRKRHSVDSQVARKSRRMSASRKLHSWKNPNCPCCMDKVYINDRLPRFKQRVRDRPGHSRASLDKKNEDMKAAKIKKSSTLPVSAKTPTFSRLATQKRCRSSEAPKKILKPSKNTSKTFNASKVTQSVKSKNNVETDIEPLKKALKQTKQNPKPSIARKAAHSVKCNDNIKSITEPIKDLKLSKHTAKASNASKETHSVKIDDNVKSTTAEVILPMPSPSPLAKTLSRRSDGITRKLMLGAQSKTTGFEARRRSTPSTRNFKSRIPKEMIYVSERLPRFKERDHIKSRPGVAIMGKPLHKAIFRRKSSALSKTNAISQKIKVKKFVKKRSEICPVVSEPIFKHVKQTPNKKPELRKRLSEYASLSRRSTSNDTQKCELDPNKAVSESELSGCDPDVDVFDGEFFEKYCQEQLDIHCGQSQNVIQSHCLSSESPQRESNTLSKVKIVHSHINVNLPATEIFHKINPMDVFKRPTEVLVRAKLEAKVQVKHSSEHRAPQQEDDLFAHLTESNRATLNLFRFSALPSSHLAAGDVYTFGEISREEVLALSAKVVDTMHADGTLLVALRETMQKTGSIKRGSLQDRRRCWDSVTPWSPSYDPKLNAILCLRDEYQTAITDPLVACVVKNYLCYKKYQFDCLPIVCDRMEEMYQIEKNSL